jgi:hypothetical protein
LATGGSYVEAVARDGLYQIRSFDRSFGREWTGGRVSSAQVRQTRSLQLDKMKFKLGGCYFFFSWRGRLVVSRLTD